MERTASLERSSPASASAPSGPALASKPASVSKDTSETGNQRWSLFSRGGSPAPAIREPQFLRACDAFWDALGTDDVDGVKTALKDMSILQRERIFMTPSAEATPGVWLPKLPLCRTVATGKVAMTEALLQAQADPWMGDPWIGGGAQEIKQPAATPAYWGVIYGQPKTLRLIYKQTRSTLDARRALCQTVPAEVLTWLVSKGVTPEELAPAMSSAVARDDAAGVRLLAKVGKADVNALCPTSESQTAYCSLLAYALAIDKLDAAAVLVEFGAHPANAKSDPAPKGSEAVEENFPLTMAIRKGHVGLITQMLHSARKASELQKAMPSATPPVSASAYLLAAFDAPNTVETYMAMYRAGLRPKEIVDTEMLLAQAKDKNFDFLYAFISRQRTVLLLNGDKKGTDDARRMAKAALEQFADALAEHPQYASPTPLLDHAQAMNLETVMPSRSVFHIFNRWGAKKGKQAGNALANAAAKGAANAVGMPGPFLLQM